MPRYLDSRIVITGVGAVAPNGIGRESYFDAIAGGRSGVRPISLFDPSALTSRIAGEVSAFDPTVWIDSKELRHVSRVE